jgi:putative ABC transport system substrate-binding protein
VLSATRALLLVGLAMLAGVLPAWAQARTTPPRIGFLNASTAAAAARQIDAFRQGLREQGYAEGAGITIEYRFADGRFERLPQLARELVELRVDVLVSVVTEASRAARSATSTIPIVMVGVGDPVAAGLVASLARPGGNVTGNSSSSAETAGKSLELLREVAPGMRRVAVLWNPANRVFQGQMVEATAAAARALGLEVSMQEARDADSVGRAFEAMSRDRVGGLDLMPDPALRALAARIASLAIRHRLASVSGDIEYPSAGGLIAYSASSHDLHRRAAVYVARILRGEKPADLPVELPTTFELVINRKTARQLGLTVPPPLLLRADRVLE